METGEMPVLLTESLKDLAPAGVYRIGNQFNFMKKLLLLFSLGSFLFFNAANAQTSAPSNSPTPVFFDPNTGLPIPPQEPSLPRFDLSFPGGTPKDLVRAVEKETGQTLNAIIPKGSEDVKLPELHLKDVTMLELSEALKLSSEKRDILGKTYSCSFKTASVPTTNSIWVFYQGLPTHPPEPVRVCRFYQLAPYLEEGFKVEDITTAVETGWKMLGNQGSDVSYHKDTKLLIAVGDPDALTLVDQVLAKLPVNSKDDPYAAATKRDKAKSMENSAP
jgi:hypothetical protein